MSYDIETMVRRIISDECKDCPNACELCEHGPCEDVVIHVGLFFINWTIDEFAKHKEKQ